MPQSRGHLNPGSRGVFFDRFELGSGLEELVRHVWVVRWSIPPGEVSAQRVLSYPAFNAILAPDGASLHGPDPRPSIRELSGTSWTVGILLRPAAAPFLTSSPTTALVGSSEPLTCAVLARVTAAMNEVGAHQSDSTESFDQNRTAPEPDDLPQATRSAVVGNLRSWLMPLAAQIDDRARLVNSACALAETDPSILRAADLAERHHISPRTLERTVKQFIGLSPKWLIECRRLQHAASTLFAEPKTDLTALAAALGYADYPHFARQYKAVLGETPDEARRRTKTH